jgi:hypothetical protein
MARLALADRVPTLVARLLGEGERRMTFPSAELALERLMEHEAGGAPIHVHLLPLILPPGAALDVSATPP